VDELLSRSYSSESGYEPGQLISDFIYGALVNAAKSARSGDLDALMKCLPSVAIEDEAVGMTVVRRLIETKDSSVRLSLVDIVPMLLEAQPEIASEVLTALRTDEDLDVQVSLREILHDYGQRAPNAA
jgi:hypothetical protein